MPKVWITIENEGGEMEEYPSTPLLTENMDEAELLADMMQAYGTGEVA